jgi:hypothetical protein
VFTAGQLIKSAAIAGLREAGAAASEGRPLHGARERGVLRVWPAPRREPAVGEHGEVLLLPPPVTFYASALRWSPPEGCSSTARAAARAPAVCNAPSPPPHASRAYKYTKPCSSGGSSLRATLASLKMCQVRVDASAPLSAGERPDRSLRT